MSASGPSLREEILERARGRAGERRRRREGRERAEDGELLGKPRRCHRMVSGCKRVEDIHLQYVSTRYGRKRRVANWPMRAPMTRQKPPPLQPPPVAFCRDGTGH